MSLARRVDAHMNADDVANGLAAAESVTNGCIACYAVLVPAGLLNVSVPSDLIGTQSRVPGWQNLPWV
jgi:predicted SAM-dependent methyltransferase